MLDVIQHPFRIQTTLEKRREGESEPYEVVSESSWHEADGTEITDPDRIAELEAAQQRKENS